MLPAIRGDEYRYPVPKFDIKMKDIEGFEDELKGFHEQFHDCFLSKRLFNRTYQNV